MSISRQTHSMDVIAERRGYAVVEITKDDAETQRERRYYVVRIDRDRGQVYSAIRADMPDGGGEWYAGLTVVGVAYMASGRTRATAMRHFRRLSAED